MLFAKALLVFLACGSLCTALGVGIYRIRDRIFSHIFSQFSRLVGKKRGKKGKRWYKFFWK